MFTGLIKGMGTVLEKQAGSNSAMIKIKTTLAPELKLGDSIAVNGVCLTAAALGLDWFRADMMPETLKGSNLGYLQLGAQVNLEPALTLSDRLGGHLVSGHVDGIGQVTDLRNEGNVLLIKISVPSELGKFIALKGSVAVNGVSLTVQGLSGSEFMVSLIPHTMQETNLTDLKLNTRVNIEVDLLARYVANALEQQTKPGLTVDFLSEHGFR